MNRAIEAIQIIKDRYGIDLERFYAWFIYDKDEDEVYVEISITDLQRLLDAYPKAVHKLVYGRGGDRMIEPEVTREQAERIAVGEDYAPRSQLARTVVALYDRLAEWEEGASVEAAAGDEARERLRAMRACIDRLRDGWLPYIQAETGTLIWWHKGTNERESMTDAERAVLPRWGYLTKESSVTSQ